MSPRQPCAVGTHPSPRHWGLGRGGRHRHHHEDCPPIEVSPSPSRELEDGPPALAEWLPLAESRMG